MGTDRRDLKFSDPSTLFSEHCAACCVQLVPPGCCSQLHPILRGFPPPDMISDENFNSLGVQLLMGNTSRTKVEGINNKFNVNSQYNFIFCFMLQENFNQTRRVFQQELFEESSKLLRQDLKIVLLPVFVYAGYSVPEVKNNLHNPQDVLLLIFNSNRKVKSI